MMPGIGCLGTIKQDDFYKFTIKWGNVGKQMWDSIFGKFVYNLPEIKRNQ
jgi:hypothetical protein